MAKVFYATSFPINHLGLTGVLTVLPCCRAAVVPVGFAKGRSSTMSSKPATAFVADVVVGAGDDGGSTPSPLRCLHTSCA